MEAPPVNFSQSLDPIGFKGGLAASFSAKYSLCWAYRQSPDSRMFNRWGVTLFWGLGSGGVWLERSKEKATPDFRLWPLLGTLVRR